MTTALASDAPHPVVLALLAVVALVYLAVWLVQLHGRRQTPCRRPVREPARRPDLVRAASVRLDRQEIES